MNNQLYDNILCHPFGSIIKAGRILTARLLMGDPIEGITHCAIGEGDDTFTDPLNPPAPEIDQTMLKNERARKKFYKRTFLKEDPEGTLVVDGIHFLETLDETRTIAIFFRFGKNEANGITIREYGFFGGNVQYVNGIESDYAINGIYHPETNPAGEVLIPGYLFEIKHTLPFTKILGTQIEVVEVIRI